MKNSSMTLLLLLLFTFQGRAAGDPYAENMLQAKALADSATVEKSLAMAANYFGRISAMNPEEWLPHYYAAYCFARIGLLNNEVSVRDSWVDKAQAEVNLAFELNSESAEIMVMKGFVMLARMSIDPMVRGFRYNDETMGYFNTAREMDPENPRAYLWQGVNILHTPEMFGGGKENACPLIKQANDKFEKFSPADSLSPDWGYGYAMEMLKNCQ